MLYMLISVVHKMYLHVRYFTVLPGLDEKLITHNFSNLLKIKLLRVNILKEQIIITNREDSW